jgi:uncharacterized protein YjiS (DUF1127 family)
MTTFTIARPAFAAPSATGLATALLARLVALDAGYRGAHRLAHADDALLADVGITRAAARTEFATRGGRVDAPATSFGAW